ncbi:MAG: hypothetical protein CM1200mP25_4630 [Acidobacteriota bacterium]|nr:MAG: hypothetical protein CM1200mP25_4630 [Acidobacteriota bacterium]
MVSQKYEESLLSLTSTGSLFHPTTPAAPLSTMVSAQVCAGLPNFDILEYQWNEVPWRGDLVDPPEQFSGGILEVPDGPGHGVTLNGTVVREHT